MNVDVEDNNESNSEHPFDDWKPSCSYATNKKSLNLKQFFPIHLISRYGTNDYKNTVHITYFVLQNLAISPCACLFQGS